MHKAFCMFMLNSLAHTVPTLASRACELINVGRSSLQQILLRMSASPAISPTEENKSCCSAGSTAADVILRH